MKTVAIILVTAVLAIAVFGGDRVLAGESVKHSATCDKRFDRLDSGDKGYLSRNDFQRGWDGPLGYKNIGPYGNVISGFSAADKNDDGRLSRGEYCDWKSHS